MLNTEANWYRVDNAGEIDSPALLIYPQRVVDNIRTAKSMVRSPHLLRPHVKTHKSPDAVRLQLAEGITNFKCATIAEAEMLALAGAPDVLLAYQPVGPKIARLRELTRQYRSTTFACLVDNMNVATALDRAFAEEPTPLRIFIDLNTGGNRTGITPDQGALDLYRGCAALSGITPVGLHAYDGHIHEKEPLLRDEQCRTAFAPVRSLREGLRRAIGTDPRIVAGGSPTFPTFAREPEIECSPGTFIYWDKQYLDDLADQSFIPAALVLSRVISRPATDLYCLDLGHKSVASEKDIHHRIFFLNAPEAEMISHSEEHCVIRLRAAGRYEIGDVLYGLPFHICPTCALYERAVTIVDHRARGDWRITARDRRINT
jgi:D-serine deaminase-like pyridoxal phosphate-dependent protein